MNIYEISYYHEDLLLAAVVIAQTDEVALRLLNNYNTKIGTTKLDEIRKIKRIGEALSSERARLIIAETVCDCH